MKSLARSIALALTLAASGAHAAPWTYRGTLNDGGAPANGRYDIRLSVLDAGGVKSLVYPLTFSGVEVKDGAFAVDVDFGIDLGELGAVKLKTEVAQGGSGFVALGEPKTFDAKAALVGVCWDTQGNAGTNPTTDFLGTIDAQPLVLRTQNVPSLRIEPSAALFNGSPATTNTIAGSSANNVTTGVRGATISGGGVPSGSSDPDFANEAPNRVTDHYGFVGGGYRNQAGDGLGLTSDAAFAVVAGGAQNTASGPRSTVGGGDTNVASEFRSTISGGSQNTASGLGASIGGGVNNAAVGQGSAVAGGSGNCAGGTYSWSGGRRAKSRPATDPGALVQACDGLTYPGGSGDAGTFIWADSQELDFVSTGSNQFLVRADGGLMLNTNAPFASGDDLVVGARPIGGDADSDLRLLTRSNKSVNFFVNDTTGSLSIVLSALATGNNRISVSGGAGGAATLSNGGAWTNASSRSFKTGLMEVDPTAILDRLVALPISTWTYLGSDEGTHLGPMAEDFKAAFDLAGDGKSIATVDADGVALAAIQGLNHKLEAEKASLQAQLRQLAARLAALEAAGER